jgi:hypothetical protein
MKATQTLVLNAVLVLASSLAAPAHAQYMNHMRPGVNFTNAYAANADIILSSMQKRVQMNSYVNSIRASQNATASRTAAPAAAPKPAGPPPAPRQPITATDFKPAGKRDTAEQMAAAVAQPAGRAQMLQAFREIQPMIEGMPGFRRNNLASALTILVVGSIQVLTGQELSEQQAQGLMLVINDEVVATGGLEKLSAEKRTRFYDALVLTSGLMLGIANNAAEANDREMMEVARRMAREGLASVGIRL